MNEMQVLKLSYDIPPSVNHYLALRTTMKNGKPLGINYKTKEAVKYQKGFAEYVAGEVERQGWVTSQDKFQHYYVDAVFYFPRMDMDANNYWKIPLDAITDTKLIWQDDNVVCDRVKRILYDSVSPRMELTIYPVDYIGVFDDTSQMDAFEAICIGCRRYKRNCSILRNAKLGKIQKEITDNKCSEYKGSKQSAKNGAAELEAKEL